METQHPAETSRADGPPWQYCQGHPRALMTRIWLCETAVGEHRVALNPTGVAGRLPGDMNVLLMVWLRVIPDRIRGWLFEHHLPIGRI